MKIFGIDIGEKKDKASGACCGPECCAEPAAEAVQAGSGLAGRTPAASRPW